jgi:hypothetical protein
MPTTVHTSVTPICMTRKGLIKGLNLARMAMVSGMLGEKNKVSTSVVELGCGG